MEPLQKTTPGSRRTKAVLRLVDSRLWLTIRKIYVPAVLLAIVVISLLGIWAVLIEPGRLVITEESISPRRWPRELDGFKVVAISDIHAGAPHITLTRIRTIVGVANALEPDLIVLLGDYMIGSIPGGTVMEPEKFAPVLAELRARHGVYAVLGNHDWNYDGPHVARAFEASGLKVLTNEAVSISANGTSFNLVGIGDFFTYHHNLQKAFAGVDSSKPVMTITHTPDIFATLPEAADFMIAGHTHGGQVNLPFLGRLVVPSNFGQRYAIGHIQEGGRDLYVTTGIGTSILPIRFRVPPEIAVITLRSTS